LRDVTWLYSCVWKNYHSRILDWCCRFDYLGDSWKIVLEGMDPSLFQWVDLIVYTRATCFHSGVVTISKFLYS
jgi:hypothetical protein